MADGDLEIERPRAILPRGRRVAAFVVTALALYGGGLGTGWWLATTTGRAVPASAQSVAPLLWQAWNLAESHYVDTSSLSSQGMVYGAIAGMLQALGDTDHTRFLSPTEVQQEKRQLSGHFVGIGIQVDIKNGLPEVVAALPSSPAQKAGLKTGDVILAVNGVETAQVSLTQLGQQIQGPAGSNVTLRILRPAEQRTFTVQMTRAAIATPEIDVHQFTVGGTSIVHLHVVQFGENADTDLRSALQAAKQAHADALILDLRDNPGGLFDQAVAVTSEFLSSGTVLQVEGRNGVKRPVPVTSGGVATTIPMVVLINNGTASAAEITSGALQDQHRATLIGSTTFGTGTVLTTFSLSDGSEVLLSTQEWLTPSGKMIWHHGIVPDQAVPLPANVAPLYPDEEGSLTGDQIADSSDAQLARAIHDLVP